MPDQRTGVSSALLDCDRHVLSAGVALPVFGNPSVFGPTMGTRCRASSRVDLSRSFRRGEQESKCADRYFYGVIACEVIAAAVPDGARV